MQPGHAGREGINMSATTTNGGPRSRWHDLYRSVPSTIAPRSESDLEMFRAMATSQRDRPLVHYFDRSISVTDIDAMSDALAVALQRRDVRPGDRITAVETGGCPHTAVRDDVSQNLDALRQLMRRFSPDLMFVESGGDNLAAQFSRELADFTIYVIDVSGGDKIPRKGGPGITQSDLLVINKTDLAPLVGAGLDVMARDARAMRGAGPFAFTQVINNIGVRGIADAVLGAWTASSDR